MTTPARVVCSLCWAIVGTYLASWFIVGTPNLIHLPWAGKACILVVGGIAWACIDKGWKDMRWDDQLNFADRKTKQKVSLAAGEGKSSAYWREWKESNSGHSLPPHLQVAVKAVEDINKLGSMSKEDWEASMRGFNQSPPKPAPMSKGGGYQPIGGSEATPPKDE